MEKNIAKAWVLPVYLGHKNAKKNDHSETALKFLDLRAEKISISMTKFNIELKHLCQAIFGLRIEV